MDKWTLIYGLIVGSLINLVINWQLYVHEYAIILIYTDR